MGSAQEASTDGRERRGNDSDIARESVGYSEELNKIQNPELESKHEGDELHKRQNSGIEWKPEGDEFEVKNKSKQKRNRRKEKKKKKDKESSLKIIGINCAGLMSKIESFKKLLRDKEPSVFCLQETKL